jgi:hypothetical protein
MRRWVVTASVVGAVAVLGGWTAGGTHPRLRVDFSAYDIGSRWSDGTTHGAFRVVFGNDGDDTIFDAGGNKLLSLATKATKGDDSPTTSDRDTHAALVVTVTRFREASIGVRMRTERQTRTGTPNYWERAWLGWDYTDPAHFYYLVLKANGWEVGKRDPAYTGGQRFLASGGTPRYPLRRWNSVGIRQDKKQLTVVVNGRRLAVVTDSERPYLDGAVAFYDEDSVVWFDDLEVTGG